MRDLDSYLAGVFDGEGWISIQHKSGYRNRRAYTRMVVGVGMTDHTVVAMFADRFGGRVHGYKLQNGRSIYQWYLCGAKAAPALTVFVAKCITKQTQAHLALELAHMLSTHKVRGKRPRGSMILSDTEFLRRAQIATDVTAMKYADA